MEVKKIFGLSLQSISKTIIAAVTASSIVLGGMGFMLRLEMKPINDYIANQAIRSIEKQYYKINEDQEDIKSMDLTYAVDDYKSLCDDYKKSSLDGKAEAISDYYLQVNGGIR